MHNDKSPDKNSLSCNLINANKKTRIDDPFRNSRMSRLICVIRTLLHFKCCRFMELFSSQKLRHVFNFGFGALIARVERLEGCKIKNRGVVEEVQKESIAIGMNRAL